MLAYTMLTFDCKSSYVHLGMLKHAELHCSVNVFKLRIDGISVHSKHNNMNIYMKTVCVVFLQQTLTSKYTPSRCSFTPGADNYHTKTKNCNEMPNNCFTMYISHTDVLTYLPTQQPQAFAYLHTAKIKTCRSVILTHATSCLG